MNRNEQTILVLGATGRQGGATARHLIADGWRVRALSRDPAKPEAQALARAGAEIVQGNLDDSTSLAAALNGVHGVFGVLSPPWGMERGAAAMMEARQGKTLADVASAVGVEHFVYSSVGGAERNTGIPHFESKWEIEQHIRTLGLPATVLRPVAFMENYYFGRAAILAGTLTSYALRPEKPLQLIAVDDIGAFAAFAFSDPGKYVGKAIEIAGDELTMPQQAGIMSRVIGRPVLYDQTAAQQQADAFSEASLMMRWFDEHGYQADIPALRALHPSLMTLETWLRQNGWEDAQPVGNEAGGWSAT